ncbi:MAG: protein kinase [Myxococcota bacterium]
MEAHVDPLIRTSFPHPIAHAWHRVSLATSSADRIKRLLACLEVLVRVQCALALPDYLRGPPDESVEKTLERLDRPSLGHWVQLLRSTLRAIDGRELPPFSPEAQRWYLAKGRPTDAAKRLDELVELRNDEAHGRVLSVAEQDERAEELLSRLRVVLSDAAYLARYRPFRVLTSSLSRRGGFSGRVQFLVGTAPQPEPVRGSWPSRLFEESVYVTDPTGASVLEVSPFLQVIHDPGPKEDRVFVVAGTHKAKKLVLKNDATGATETVLIGSEEGDVPLDAWLAARATHTPWQSNAGASEHFGAAEKSAVGEVLAGRFEVRTKLGEGGMASVYLVWDQWDEAEFALKVLHRQLADDVAFKERFRREARTMKRLRHPHILAVDEAGQLEDGRLYLKLPLLSGGTLQDRVRAGASPLPQVEKWALQMASALEYLHDKGVVHRDIKPSNFLLDGASDAFLADFGIALQGEEVRLTRTLEQVGSIAYMSPEQRRGAAATASSDVYSLGVVLHELVTGREGDVTPGKGIAGALGELVRAMCADEATDRPTAAEAWRRLGGARAPAQVDAPRAAPTPGPAVAEPAPLEPIEELERIEAGTFEMAPGRTVTLTCGLVSAAVRADEWRGDRGGSWFDAVAYCNARSLRDGLAPAYTLSEPRPRKPYSIDDIGRMLREVVPFKRVPAILAAFGTETLAVMQFSPERLTEVPGIGEKTAAEYGAKWDRDKYFVHGVTLDRATAGWRLPTEAEWVRGSRSEPGEDWVWCADPGPAYHPAPAALAPGEHTDPATDDGPRRLVRGPTTRRAVPPHQREPGVGLRVVRRA